MARRRLLLLRLIGVVAIAAATLVLSYVALVAYAWATDRDSALPNPIAGTADYSRLSSASDVDRIVPSGDQAGAIRQLQELVRQAAASGGKVTIAGAKHSMGGHSMLDGSLSIDMRCAPFRQISPVMFQNSGPIVRVGGGATWHELLGELDQAGWSIAVMQSNDDFTIGGSVSVNCHGWQPGVPPLCSTVEAFRILLADGSVRECRRDRSEDRELFSAVCGGYGLLGVILEVDLRVIPNAFYKAEEFSTTSADFSKRFHSLLSDATTKTGLAYGRISVAPGGWFLRDARIIRFVETDPPAGTSTKRTTAANGGTFSPAPWEISIARAAFRASALSKLGKFGRWTIERFYGQTHRLVSRNGVLQTPSEWFANRDPTYTEILHEYFVPPDRLESFLEQIRPILRDQGEIDLLNITVRDVRADEISLLAYAPKDRLGLVMLFRYPLSEKADGRMAEVTQALIGAAQANGGSYYLPYRPHATLKQFRDAYPRHAEFREVKSKYDPQGVFQNKFYQTYLDRAN